MESNRDAALLWRQFAAMTRLSMRRYRHTRHLWAAIVLAGIPVVVTAIGAGVALFQQFFGGGNMLANVDVSSSTTAFAGILVGAYLHFGIIFSALIFGNSALREESDEQTLHYLFLQPIPRWLIIAGKYVGFLLVAGPVFLISMAVVQALVLLPFGPRAVVTALFEQSRAINLVREMAVIFLALATFSAFFMAVGSVLRNLLYALFIYGWEMASTVMPETLRNFSITHYFRFMLPERTMVSSKGALGFVVEAPGIIQTSLVIGFIIAGGVAFTCWMASTKECVYSDS